MFKRGSAMDKQDKSLSESDEVKDYGISEGDDFYVHRKKKFERYNDQMKADQAWAREDCFRFLENFNKITAKTK